MAPVPKSSAAAAPLLKNSAAAPIVYFNNVPVMGTYGGDIEIELAIGCLMPKPDGKVVRELNCSAHLRCSPIAAAQLMDALEKALAIHAKQQQDAIENGKAGEASPALHS